MQKITRNILGAGSFLNALKCAFRGILYLFLYHRNMRFIFLIGITVFIVGLLIDLKGIELVSLCVTITLVFMAEIFNTAVELMMDAITEKYHTKIRLIKDIAAGIVVLTCLNSVAVGYILFIHKFFR